MFYKRISDLHPLGKPHTAGHWEDIDPMGIGNPGQYAVVSQGSPQTIDFDEPTNITNYPASDGPTGLQDAFRNISTWWQTDDGTYNWTNISVDYRSEQPGDPSIISSEYYSKALWFEVDISKDGSNKPVSTYETAVKHQSKRMNAYTMMMNLDEICATVLTSQFIDAQYINCHSTLTANVISANLINTYSITADYGNISSISSTSITAGGISASLGIINHISGTNLWYQNARFTNITVDGIADLSAEAAYWADVAEIYTADNEYLYGTLVKFGGDKEITIADDKANAVVSEKPAITLNSGNKDENALPIVLTGRSRVRTIHPVKKFDKIYLSETPGVGSISSYKISSATMPIGIALESKPYDEEGLVECILQLNFE